MRRDCNCLVLLDGFYNDVCMNFMWKFYKGAHTGAPLQDVLFQGLVGNGLDRSGRSCRCEVRPFSWLNLDFRDYRIFKMKRRAAPFLTHEFTFRQNGAIRELPLHVFVYQGLVGAGLVPALFQITTETNPNTIHRISTFAVQSTRAHTRVRPYKMCCFKVL